MLDHVDVGVVDFKRYEPYTAPELVREIRQLAKELKGARVLQVNATAYGGGVSELLRSVVPIYRGLGINVDWKCIYGDPQFFSITKSFHNALQGAPEELSRLAGETYLMYNKLNADLLDDDYDFYVMHDPQPLAIRHFKGKNGAKWVWRCHIDTSSPNEEVLAFITRYVLEYDALVFTMQRFVPPGIEHQKLAIIPPAIDPLSPKNMTLPDGLCREMIAWLGVDPDRPLLTQVSRFDPWKDPFGVVEVYRRVREKVPGLQLALLGSMALDDPEGWGIYNQIVAETKGDDDIHVRTNLVGVGNMEINAFQRGSDVVIQKSIREGFGLIISETLWKGTPVVANLAGGIPLQMDDGVGGFLVENTEQAIEKVLYLLRHKKEAREIGLAGQERVRERYLTPRLVADWLRLLVSLKD